MIIGGEGMIWLGVFLFGIICTLSTLQIITEGQILMLSFIAIIVFTVLSPIIADKLSQKE
ncbi:hypothetical protein [Salinicoccus roseus]|uniref:Uncharacterized protein n=1 Tax=Salinicoccus roseus TaxID=45670 RepID=A0A0C2HK18_9STAP|nr:hypothetical protein [Salinicoccus roseus]KIH69916.1 hypothetical protein SN16_10380 [Salinicoccus roseus]MDB0581203.1 hypothetical protein [Salinicoccus roseus]